MNSRITRLEDIACEAGQAIMDIYRQGSVEVRQKDDSSPVTMADLLANDIICRQLRKFSSLPIISEEGSGEKDWGDRCPMSYWLVDPLDGTKEFIARRATFTVNIALIEDGVPVAGVIFAPDRDELYSGEGAILRLNRQPTTAKWSTEAIAVCSATHDEPQFAGFEMKNRLASILRIGSSIKFCLIAKGQAHFYPRYNSLSAWDVAAGHAVALAAGCTMNEISSGLPLRYAYERLRIPGFIVQAPGFVALV